MTTAKSERQLTPTSESSWPDKRIDRVFRDMLKDFFIEGSVRDRLVETWANSIHVEEFTEGDTYVIRAELAGIDPEKDLDIQVRSGVLTLHARREERKEEQRPDGYHTEFRYGSFRRSIRLPEGTVEADMTASYKDGIVEIRVPVTQAQQEPTRIPVSRS